MATIFTSTVNSRVVPGGSYMVQATLTGPSSYSTGGVALTADLFNLNTIENVVILGVSGGLTARWDRANSKLIFNFPTGGASAPATVTAPVAAQGALTGVPAVGTLAVTTTPDAGGTTMTGSAAKPALAGVITGALTAGTLALAAPALTGGIAIQVAASTDISSIAVEVLVFGR